MPNHVEVDPESALDQVSRCKEAPSAVESALPDIFAAPRDITDLKDVELSVVNYLSTRFSIKETHAQPGIRCTHTLSTLSTLSTRTKHTLSTH